VLGAVGRPLCRGMTGRFSFRLAREGGWELGEGSSLEWSGGCRGRVIEVPFLVKESPRAVWRPFRGGSARLFRVKGRGGASPGWVVGLGWAVCQAGGVGRCLCCVRRRGVRRGFGIGGSWMFVGVCQAVEER